MFRISSTPQTLDPLDPLYCLLDFSHFPVPSFHISSTPSILDPWTLGPSTPQTLDPLGPLYCLLDFSHFPVTFQRFRWFTFDLIKIDRHLVVVLSKRSFEHDWQPKWSEPVTAFNGVLLSKFEGNEGDFPGYLLQMVHPDPKKTLTLHTVNLPAWPFNRTNKEKEERVYKLWKDLAEALDLPALQETWGGL